MVSSSRPSICLVTAYEDYHIRQDDDALDHVVVCVQYDKDTCALPWTLVLGIGYTASRQLTYTPGAVAAFVVCRHFLYTSLLIS